MSSDWRTLASLSADLAAGRATSRMLVEECLDRYSNACDGARLALVEVDDAAALAAADAMDKLRAAGADARCRAGREHGQDLQLLRDGHAGEACAGGHEADECVDPVALDEAAHLRRDARRRAGLVGQ